ncbi:hypothetical protein Nepgr_025305 [Nepenthes gracilis]|uniref:DUF7032 domain-containing protein n=1 Tax=Nepenthes gracilis TaxID=150966 RepID=A0AAD3T7G4_NEPGR|nr:hypothetical protein Nepgr_025305 [Nepenthes gracilis]
MEETPPQGKNDLVKRSIHLLTTLLDEQLPHIHTFRGKWSLIRTKLTDLNTHLHDLADFHSSFHSDFLCADVLSSVLLTLTDTLSLAGRCRNHHLTEGKLKTQSEIDSVIAKLDRHIKDSEILFRSGVLQDAAVSTSDLSAVCSKREALRVEMRNMLTRLQIGTFDSKSEALDALLGLLNEDDKNVSIAVAQDLMPVLVRLLDSSSPDMKEKTVAVIASISAIDSSEHVLVSEGLLLLNHLIRILESGSGFAKERACVALQALSLSKENARTIGTRGGISSLLEICQSGTPSSQAVAAGVLRNLAQIEEIKENFVEENAIFVLIALSSSGTALAKENAFGCLSNLVSNDVSLKILVAREGGIESLKNYWDSTPAGWSMQTAVELLRNLASLHPVGQSLISEGFIGKVMAALSCGILGVRIAAAGAVYELGFSSKSQKEIGECGSVAPLVRMLDGKVTEEREAAAKALSRLMVYAGNQKIFKKEERGIVNAVLLLDPLTQSLDKRWPVSLLASLVGSKKCRKLMVAAGACVYLQKLVELDVDGARKLLQSLGRGKLWGVFARA